MEEFNKNEMQIYFNQVKGEISEINKGDKFSNITITVGHANKRNANFVAKSDFFDEQTKGLNIGDKVCVKYYLSSIKKFDRWYTNATILLIEKS